MVIPKGQPKKRWRNIVTKRLRCFFITGLLSMISILFRNIDRVDNSSALVSADLIHLSEMLNIDKVDPIMSSKEKKEHLDEQIGSMDSIHIVLERDLAVDYSQTTSFNGTFFDNSPKCTPIDATDVSFTLVTQASMDRLWILKHHCQRWPSPQPISIAVYLEPGSQFDESDVFTTLKDACHCDLSRMVVTILKGNSPMDRYPVNMLRNLAIRSIKTSHFAYTDSDFLISEGLYDELMTIAPLLANDPLAAVVIPAFVYLSACEKAASNNTKALECLEQEGFPKRKADLLPLWARDRKKLPNVKDGFHGKHFHGSTLYHEFKTQTEPLLLPCIENYLYEPYLAVRLCNQLPEFPEVFRGYGWNKNVWIMWLTRKLPYKLWQSSQGFVFHVPHKVSDSWRRVKKADPASGKIKSTPPEHDAYLKWFKSYPKHPDRIRPCPGSKP